MTKREETEAVVAVGSVDLSALADGFLKAIRETVGQEKDVPAIPNDGLVVVLMPNLTFAGQVYPAGSIIDMEEEHHLLESDEHENAFLRNVRAGAEETKDLAVWMPKTEKTLQEAHELSYRVYTEWLTELNARSGLEALDAQIRNIGATPSRSDAAGVMTVQGVPVRVEVGNKQPERVISLGARLGDDS